MRLFKKKDEGNQENFRCKYCNTTFESKERLKRHTKKAHGEKDSNISNPNPFGGF
ncbi:MAG TPA: C2H2-type zinc finger protein [Nitrososphaeraceae archaeon]